MIRFTWVWLAFYCGTALATLRTFELSVGPSTVNPDCSNQSYSALFINGQFPGPPLQVTRGDDVHIVIRNSFDSQQVTTVHYHGIFQTGTTEADGMPNVTQIAVAPGEVYHQRFKVVDQAGTYFYHAHIGLQDDTVYGPFIVYASDDAWPCNDHKLRDGPYEYDDERVLTLSEWWHQESQDRIDYIMGPEYSLLTAPDSYLLNGRTVYDPSRLGECTSGYSAIDVEPGKAYRLRVIGATTFTTLGLAIAHHTMTIIEVDGELVEPYETSYLEVSSGQRFSVLLTANQPPASYVIGTIPYYLTQSSTSNGVAVLRYTDKDTLHDQRSDPAYMQHILATATTQAASVPDMPAFPPATPQWFFPSLRPITQPPLSFEGAPDRTIMIVPIEERMPDNTTRWKINKHPIPEWHPPILYQLMDGSRPSGNRSVLHLNRRHESDGYDDRLQTYPIDYGETIDFVIQATNLLAGFCPGHPWHTHGMSHYAIASGPGEYEHDRDKDVRTYPTPFAKDTTLVYPVDTGSTTPGTPCGWTKIRIRAINPGVWAFHCHITGHMMQGMLTVLEVASERIPVLH